MDDRLTQQGILKAIYIDFIGQITHEIGIKPFLLHCKVSAIFVKVINCFQYTFSSVRALIK